MKKTGKKIIVKNISSERMYGVEYYKNKKEFESKRNPNHKFNFKTTNTLFASCPDIDEYLRLTRSTCNRDKFFENYEIIYSEQPVPLYFDIDYKNNHKMNIEPLDALFHYLARFMEKFELMSFGTEELAMELASKFCVSSATREIEEGKIKYIKHSYHLILREPKVLFKNQAQILLFINKFKHWIGKNGDDQYDRNLLLNLDINGGAQFIIDTSIYSRNPNRLHSFRTLDSHKGNNSRKEILKRWTHPLMGGDIDESKKIIFKTKDYYVNYYDDEYKYLKLPDWDYESKEPKISDMVPITQGLDEPPIYIKNKILSILKKKFISFDIVNTKLLNNVYYFNFESEEKCPLCSCVHERFSNKSRFTIQYNTTNSFIIFFCRASSKNVRVTDFTENDLLVPDYSYEDTEDIKCKPLLSTMELGEGGTFFLESAKGTGKSEAIQKFLAKVPADKSILLISYRISLIDKYVEELKKYNIRNYQLGFNDKSHFHRVAICKESLHKLFVDIIGKYKYDIVIIDEIYSVMESWDNLRKTNLNDLMNIFEVVVRNAKHLYLMDAHLNNEMVVKSMKAMRKEEKFIFHKNPRLYDYSDYTVNWYENNDEDSFRGYQNMILQDIINGKKIAVISSTKSYVDETYNAILKHNNMPNDLKIFKYTSSEDDAELKKLHFKNVEKYWSDKCVILYSPTISAGISYNKTGLEGFDKLYVYVTPTGNNTASINTFGQMIFRIRQLNDKCINIFFNTKKYRGVDIEEHQIGSKLDQRCSLLINEFGTPLKNNGICLDTLKPLYDKEHWTYNIWFQTTLNKIRYSKVSNFREYFYNLLCNKPCDQFAGRGMRFNDCSKDIIEIEDSEKVFLENIITKDKSDRLDNDFVRFYTNTDPKNRQYIENVFGSKMKEFNIKCLDLIVRKNIDNNLTLEELGEYEDRKKLWKVYMGVGYQCKYKRYKNWVNNKNDDSFVSLYKKYLTDSSSTTLFWDDEAKLCKVEYTNKIKPAVVEGLVARGYHFNNILYELCKLLELPVNTNLNGTILKREVFEKALKDRSRLNSLFMDIRGKTRLMKDVKRNYNLVLRKNIQVWQQSNPNTCVYDLDEEGINKFFKETGVNHTYQGFKKSELKRGVKKRDEKIKQFLNGEWCYAEWKTNDPYEFTVETLKNNVSKMFELAINSKLETVGNGTSYQWDEQIIRNNYARDGLV